MRIIIPESAVAGLLILAAIGTPFMLLAWFVVSYAEPLAWTALAATALGAMTLVWKRTKSVGLVLGIPVAAMAGFLAYSAMPSDPAMAAQAFAYQRWGTLDGEVGAELRKRIEMRLTEAEGCIGRENEPSVGWGGVPHPCTREFGVRHADPVLIAEARAAVASEDWRGAQGAVERISGEPLMRAVGPVAWTDFAAWWRTDAGLRCDASPERGPAEVLVYCMGSDPEAAARYCAANVDGDRASWSSAFRAMCGGAHVVPASLATRSDGSDEALEAATSVFPYCFRGTCLDPENPKSMHRLSPESFAAPRPSL